MVGPYNFMKASPILQSLAVEFSLTPALAGLFMGIFGITMALLSLPGGIMVASYGSKRIGMAGLISIIIGTGLGSIAMNVQVLYFGRLLEGVGMALLVTAAPSLIVLWFTTEEFGRAMGIWSVFFPLASVIALNLSGAIGPAYGWRIIWLSGFVYAIIMCAVLAIIKEKPMTNPTHVSGEQTKSRARFVFAPYRQALASIDMWLVSLAYLGAFAPVLAFGTWAPTYFNLARGLPLDYAAFIAGLFFLAVIPGSFVGGIVSDRLRSRKRVYLPSIILPPILFSLLPYTPAEALPLVVLISGFAAGIGPPALFACAPEILGGLAPIGLGMLNTAIGVGLLCGPAVFGLIYQMTGSWIVAFDALVAFGVAGVILGWLPKGIR
jgi:MFS family permease